MQPHPYLRQSYSTGVFFLETDSHGFVVIPENTTPTGKELYRFHLSPMAPALWLGAALDLIKRCTLQFGNKGNFLSTGYGGATATAGYLRRRDRPSWSLGLPFGTPKLPSIYWFPRSGKTSQLFYNGCASQKHSVGHCGRGMKESQVSELGLARLRMLR